MFLYLPINQSFNLANDTMAKVTFLIMAVYFYYSGLQISQGFAIIIQTQQSKKIGWIETYKQKLIYDAPIFYEISAIYSWTLSKTSLDLGQWFILTDIEMNLLFSKYQAEHREEYEVAIQTEIKL